MVVGSEYLLPAYAISAVIFSRLFSAVANGEKCADHFVVPLESLVLMFIVQWTKPEVGNQSAVDTRMVKCAANDSDGFKLNKHAFHMLSMEKTTAESVPVMVKRCRLPAVVTEEQQMCVAGLCNISRAVLKHSHVDECLTLLGFRSSCLSSCCQVSLWTGFCERDIMNCAKASQGLRQWIEVPLDISRFEGHLNEPLRAHNIGKLKHQMKCQQIEQGQDAVNGEVKEPQHEFAEGNSLTLADLIIFVCIQTVFERMPTNSCNASKCVPAVVRWYRRMFSNPEVIAASKSCGLTEISFGEVDDLPCKFDVIPNQSFYIRDPKWNKSLKMETKQGHLKDIFERLVSAEIAPNYERPAFLTSWERNWDEMPHYVQPINNLPKSRLERKCDQLRNMAVAVCNIATDGDIVVDFCSGGGHLGILLAYLLPKCHIIMIENKEESAVMILNRIELLPNTTVYQSNVDYFHGEFNIGVALHACGTATDLVIQKCLKQNAAFVTCPCCYGSIRANSNVFYPRSQRFQSAGITTEEHRIVGHAADQTHENGHKNEQGKFCMGLIDTDRCMEAEEQNYRCKLFTMEPTNCTLKNNVLLGLPSSYNNAKFEWW